MRNTWITLIVAVVLTACTYSVYQTAYPYLKTIRIESFENKTVEYSLEQDLLEELTDSFQGDGELQVVEISPNCQLEGTILDYENVIYTYDTNNNIKEYVVKILFNVKLTDFVKNEVLWEKESLLLSETYLAQPSNDTASTEPESEEEAQKEVFKDLYDTILENTFQSW